VEPDAVPPEEDVPLPVDDVPPPEPVEVPPVLDPPLLVSPPVDVPLPEPLLGGGGGAGKLTVTGAESPEDNVAEWAGEV
jgi:hypothetical protein